jgi:drug/metabolite transporter (DMT)-like permease
MNLSLAALAALPVITGLASVIWSQLAEVSWRLPTLANAITYVLIYVAVAASDTASIRADFGALYRSEMALPLGSYIAVCGAISFLWLYALRDSSVAAIGFVEIGYPVFILLFAFLLFGKVQLNTYHWIGGLTVLAGTSVVLLGNLKS